MMNSVAGKLVVVLKGYPRLSETFIAQELLGLERAGIELIIVSLRQPTDSTRHAVHDEIKAPVNYLPEYLHQSPFRVLRAMISCLKRPGLIATFKHFLADFRRDPTRNRVRRFGQALVLSAEWPEGAQWLHAHFIHTPASVAAYTSSICNIPWTASAHAKDIWTSPDWEVEAKLGSAQWVVTCTAVGHRHLQSLAPDASRVHLSYHGIDLTRFPVFDRSLSTRNGNTENDPVVIVSVGRAVAKKGFDILLNALALLPTTVHWRFVHIGGGAELDALKVLAHSLNIENRITWLGAINQRDVLAAYQSADVFALACRVTSDGDRDGLPNVLVEAASQGLACVSTEISAIPELFVHGQNGLLVAPDNPKLFSDVLLQAIQDPALRSRLGTAAQEQVRNTLDHQKSINQLAALFEEQGLLVR